MAARTFEVVSGEVLNGLEMSFEVFAGGVGVVGSGFQIVAGAFDVGQIASLRERPTPSRVAPNHNMRINNNTRSTSAQASLCRVCDLVRGPPVQMSCGGWCKNCLQAGLSSKWK